MTRPADVPWRHSGSHDLNHVVCPSSRAGEPPTAWCGATDLLPQDYPSLDAAIERVYRDDALLCAACVANATDFVRCVRDWRTDPVDHITSLGDKAVIWFRASKRTVVLPGKLTDLAFIPASRRADCLAVGAVTALVPDPEHEPPLTPEERAGFAAWMIEQWKAWGDL